MSNVIDQRVVEMRFDNQQFERNVSTTMSTLEKLKSRLNLSGASKGMENLGAAARGVNLNGLSSAVENVRSRFSALEVMGVTALANITNSAVNAGKRMLSALTIDPVKTGFQEYELKMGSVQTIMASTGESLATVNKYLEELNKYSDQTIYSFSDMTQNIGKFTNAGVKLDDAVLAIKGISNEAALSGANANEASRAMYNFSQALSAGYVKLIDWKSIENANMATVGFKEELIKTGLAMGTVTKAGDGMYQTLSGETFNATKNFNEVLQEQWMTSEVLIETLKKYADENTEIGKKAKAAATEVKTATMLFDTLKEAAQSGWAQTWEILVGDFDKAKSLFTGMSNVLGGIIEASSRARNFLLEGALNLAKPWTTMMEKLDKLKGAAENVGDLTKKLEHFQDVVDRVWKGEFFNSDTGRYELLEKAGYDHRVVQDLVNKGRDYKLTVKDIEESHKKFGLTMDKTSESSKGLASTLASLSDEQLREAGFTEEEIRLFRDLAKEAERTGVSIEDLVERMSKKDGRTLLLDSFKNILQGIGAVLKGMKDAWTEIFPPMSVVTLYNIIDAFNKFSQNLTVGDKTAQNIKDTFKGLFAILDIILTVVGGPLKWAFKGLTTILGMFDMNVWDLTGSIGRSIVKFRDWIDEHNIFTKGLEKVVPWIKKFADSISKWFTGLKDVDDVPKYLIEGFVNGIKTGVKTAVEAIIDLGESILEAFLDILGIHSPSTETFEAAKWFIQGFIDGIKAFGAHAWDSIKGFGSGILKVFNFIIDGVAKYAPKVWNVLSGFIKKCVDVLKEMDWGAILTVGIAVGFLVVAARISSALAKLSAPLEGFQDVAHSLKKVMNSLALDIKAQALITVAKAIAILAGSIIALTFVEPGKLWNAVGVLAVLTGLLAGLTFVMGKFGPKEGLELGKITLAIIGISAALLILSKAMKTLSGIDQNGLIRGGAAILALGGIMVGLVAMTKLFNKDAIGIGSTLLLMSASILLMVFVAKSLSKLDPEMVVKGTLGVSAFGILMGGLLLITRLARPGELKGLGTTMLLMSASLLLMIFVVKQAAKLDAQTVLKGSLAVGAFIILFGGLLAITRLAAVGDNGKAVKGIGRTLLGMAAAMLIMALAVKTLGNLDTKTLIKGGVAIALLSGIIVALIKVTQLAEKQKSVGGGAILGVGIAIGILAGIAVLLGFVKIEHLAKGIVAVGLLGAILGGLIIATKKARNIKGSVIAMAIAIGVMAGAVAALSLIDPKAMATSTAALILLMGAFGLMGKVLGNTKIDIGSILTMTLVVAALASMLGLMDHLNVEGSLKTAGSLAILLVSIGVAMEIIDGTHVTTGDVAKTALMGLVIAELAIILGLMAALNVEASIQSATSLSILLLALSASMAIVSHTQVTTKDVAMMALMGLVVAELAIILGVMAAMDVQPSIETATALSILLIGLSAALAIVSAVGMMSGRALAGTVSLVAFIAAIGGVILGLGYLMTEVEQAKTWFDSGLPILEQIIVVMEDLCGKALITFAALGAVGLLGGAAVAGALAFDAVIVAIGGLITGIGALVDKFPQLEKFLDTGMPILEKIGEAIGLFFGNIAGGFIEGVSDSLPGLGENLSLFMKKAKPFIAGCNDVTGDTVAGAGFLAASIAALTVADLMSGIASWIQNGSSFADLGADLSAFMNNAKDFITGVNGIDPSAAEGAGTVAKMILALTAADLLNSIASLFGMDVDFSSFGVQLEAFGKSLVGFSNTVKGNIDAEAVQAASDAGLLMTALAKDVPRSGSTVIKWLVGEKDLGVFGDQLVKFGEGLVKFSDAVTNEGNGINAEAIEAAAKAGELMSTLANGIPANGSTFIKWLCGEKNLGEFGNQLVEYGKALVKFSDAVTNEGNGINADAIDAAAKAGEVMGALAKNGIPSNGSSFIKWICGEKDLGTFGTQLAIYGTGIAAFAKSIGDGISEDAVTSAANAGKILSELAKTLPDTEDKWYKNVTTLDDFGKSIGSFGQYLSNFYGWIKDINAAHISSITLVVDSLADTIADMEDLDTDGVDELKDAIDTLSKANVSGFKSAFSADASDSVARFKTVKDAITSLVGLDSSGASAFKSAVSQLAGASMSKFIDNFSTSAVTATNNMKTIKSGIAGLSGFNSSGATSLVSAINKLVDAKTSKLSKTFGTSFSDVTNNMNVLKKGINKLVDLDSSKVDNYTNAINTLGKAGVSKFLKAFSDATPTLKTTGATMVNSVADGIKSKSSAIPGSLTSSLSQAVSNARGYRNSFYSAGSYLVDGFASGISANSYRAAAQASAMAAAAANAARSMLQIKSPSRVFYGIGDFAGQGFVNALLDACSSTYDAGMEMADSARNGLNNAIRKATALINGEMDLNPTIRPVLDLSEVRSGIGALGGMLGEGPSVGVRANLNAISSSMRSRGQNGVNGEVVSAINKLNKKLDDMHGDTYQINGINYEEGSDVANAIQLITRTALRERRV